MIRDKIHILFEQLPEVFGIDKEIIKDPHFEDRWFFVPKDEFIDDRDNESYVGRSIDAPPGNDFKNLIDLRETFSEHSTTYTPWDLKDAHPPTDALGFYLPFHYGYPKWWGIYLIYEGCVGLGVLIKDSDRSGKISTEQAFNAASNFIYHHEYYHHRIESFATRLEMTHRKPIFIDGIKRNKEKYKNSIDHIEETLANTYAYLKIKDEYKRKKGKNEILLGLRSFMERQPIEYRESLNYLSTKKFKDLETDLFERYHLEIYPNKDDHLWDGIWNVAGGFSRGIGNIKSHVKYMIERDSTYAERNKLQLK